MEEDLRPYNENMLHEIKRELAFIWAAHRLHRLDGKMRLFSPRTRDNFQMEEAGYEVWFGPTEIDLVVKKIEILYKEGKKPNTPLFLDPVVYRKLAGAKPIPLGSGVVWCTGLVKGGKEMNPLAQKRLEKLGVFVDTYHSPNSEKAGLKALAFLENIAMPMDKEFNPEGSIVPGVQQLADLMNIDPDGPYNRYYLLSDLEYTLADGTVFQNPEFQDIFHGTAMKSIKDITANAIHLQLILDAGKCWNAYGRDQAILDRYGTDVANLERNLQSKNASDRVVAQIRHELQLLWAANKRAGLDGEMRMYSAPTQDNWRSKKAGTEVWFRDEEEDYVRASRQIQDAYNAGVLPNTPLLIDPVVYKRDEKGYPTPLGTAIVWGNCMCVGKQAFEPSMLDRIKDIGLLTGKIIRAGDEESGLKVLGFVEQPFLFGEEDINEYKRQQYNETAKQAMRDRIEKERKAMVEKGYNDEQEKAFNERAQKLMDSVPETIVMDVLPVPGCREIFDVSGANGEEYWGYYLTTGLEYLCANGAYANPALEITIPTTPEVRDAFIQQYTTTVQRLLDAGKCWEQYNRLHPLWQRFGIDTAKLEENLKYFNLCGRKLELLSMTGESRQDGEDKFEFVVPGWVPRSAITIIGATGGTGKSSLAHRLAILTSSDWRDDEPGPQWLGSEISKEDCKGISVYLSGEDAASIVNARADIIDPEKRSKRLLLKCGAEFGFNADNTEKTIDDFLEELHCLPKVDMVVIDPVRKYLTGNEDDAEVVSQFFEAIEKFAIAKNCGMVVVHHLQKKAHPRDTRDIVDLLRGSQVFVDRARVVIGLMREGEKAIAGLAKNNIPAKLGMVQGERVFVRDGDRLDLIWLPGEAGVRSFDVSAEELEKIKAEANEAKKA